MSSVNSDEYYELRVLLFKLKKILEDIGFSNVISPVFENSDYNRFEGSTKALDNFKKLKQVDSMLVIYPRYLPSSVLVEMGYGLALYKKMVIFYKENLPYIFKDSTANITHVDARHYSQFDEIVSTIELNGMQLFQLPEEE